MDNNYPANIRSFDDDPNSPFYIEPRKCEQCQTELNCNSQDEYGYPESFCPNVDCKSNAR